MVEKEPGREFLQAHWFPCLFLIWIQPYARVGSNVLGEVDKERNQSKAQQKVHGPFPLICIKVDFCFEEKDGSGGEEEVSNVGEIVVGEEVEVGENGNRKGDPQRGEVFETKVEDTPNSGNITAHCAVHEAGEQGNVADLEKTVFRVAPRADTFRGLEDFHNGSKKMEDENDPAFAKAFQFE